MGALFLSVLLVITVWERRPIAGALIVSTRMVAADDETRAALGLARTGSISGNQFDIVLSRGKIGNRWILQK